MAKISRRKFIRLTAFNLGSLDVSHIPAGAHTLKVWAYDRFLNRVEQTRKIEFG
jgi:hypothetical protein